MITFKRHQKPTSLSAVASASLANVLQLQRAWLPPREAPITGANLADLGWELLIHHSMKLRARTLRGFVERRVSTSVGRMRVLEYRHPRRRGPTWVFVHGFSSEGIQWAPLLRRMRRHCARILVPDLPGHGSSPLAAGQDLDQAMMLTGLAETLHTLLASHEHCVWVANSMGGIAAVSLSDGTLPGPVAGAILLSPAGAPPENMADIEHVLQRFGNLTVHNIRHLVGAMCPHLTWSRTLVAHALRAHLQQPRYQRLLRHYPNIQFLRTEQVRKLGPSLVVFGQQDDVLPASSIRFWESALPPGGTLLRPKTFGHVPFIDQTAAVYAHIMAFVAQHPHLLQDGTLPASPPIS